MRKFILFILGLAIGISATYLYLTSNENTVTMTEPKGLIKPDQMKTLDKAYDSRYTLVSDSISRRPDNRSSWFSIVDIKNYIALAEKEAQTLGYTLDGLRVYLGAYPDSKAGVGLTTMFFAPTGTKNVSDGSMVKISQDGGSHDIEGGSGLNKGSQGNPPSANYPQ